MVEYTQTKKNQKNQNKFFIQQRTKVERERVGKNEREREREEC
jgi:hypothetical protein